MFGRSKKILLTCPSCGHHQEESHAAQSTYCRGCSGYYKIAEGAAVPAPAASQYPFPVRKEPIRREVAARRPAPKAAPSLPKLPARRDAQLEFFSARALPSPAAPEPPDSAPARLPVVATSSGDHPALARMARRLPETPRPGHRHVHCLDCDFPQSIPLGALSTMCLRCTAPIPLQDYEVHELQHRRIRTRGNVHVHRKGGIRGVSVQCNDLTIEGDFTGTSIDCDGELLIRRSGTITGPVRCRRLVVQGRADLTFTHPVHAQEIVIDGTVTGDMICEQKLHLAAKSLLVGDIQTRSLSVSEGARHSGMVSMPQLEERYAKFGDLADIEGMDPPQAMSRTRAHESAAPESAGDPAPAATSGESA